MTLKLVPTVRRRLSRLRRLGEHSYYVNLWTHTVYVWWP